MGRPVIHFDMGSPLNYDPLFEYHDFKWLVSSKDSLISKIEEIYALDEEEFNAKQAKAKSYISRYFYPITQENLRKFIF